MRADRLIATLLLMQARGRVTAAMLAEELGVSVVTARRDLEALAVAGVPVYSQPGRGGGWSLIGGARTDLSGFTAMEAQALFLLVGPASSVAPETRSALRKLLNALPETFRTDAEAAASATINDPSRWGATDRERSDLVKVLQTAVVRRRKVRLTYTRWGGEQTERLVDPWGLADKNDVWYLVAGTAGGQRTFRVDRMLDAVMTELEADRSDDFVLSDAWERIVGEVEQQRSAVSATLLVDTAEHMSLLRSQFGQHCTIEGSPDARPLTVRVAAPSVEVISSRLAGLGGSIEVVEPDAVRDELARIGRELTLRYGT